MNDRTGHHLPSSSTQRLAEFPPPDARRRARAPDAFEARPERNPRRGKACAGHCAEWAPRARDRGARRRVLRHGSRGQPRRRARPARARIRRARISQAGSTRGARAAARSSPYAEPDRWVTRERPKIDRIACPWLVRRFIDPGAEFHYVPAAEVRGFAAIHGATPFDVADVAVRPRRRPLQLRRVHPHPPPCRPGARSTSRRSCAAPTRAARAGRAESRAARRDRKDCRRCSPTITRCCARGMMMYDALYLWCRRMRRRATPRLRERERPPEREQRARARSCAGAQVACPHPSRSVPLLAPPRLHQLRRARRPDRDHASRTGRRAALDLGGALPARAQLLHGAAGAGGTAARDLHRLAHAPDLGRHRRRRAVRAAVARRSSIALSWLYMAYGNVPAVAGILHGVKPAVVALVLHAAWRIGSRTLKHPALWAHRGAGVRRDLRVVRAVSVDRSRGGPDRRRRRAASRRAPSA